MISTEVILNWWLGEVKETYKDYFVAKMIDVNGDKSIAEFDITSVREEDQESIHVGATFTFAITRQDHPDGRRLVSEIACIEPYHWTAKDEEKAIALMQEHFSTISAFEN